MSIDPLLPSRSGRPAGGSSPPSRPPARDRPGGRRPGDQRPMRLVAVAAACAAVLIAALIVWSNRGGDEPQLGGDGRATVTLPAPGLPPTAEVEIAPEPTQPADGALDAAPDTAPPDVPASTPAPEPDVTNPPSGTTEPGIDVVGSDWWLVNPRRPLPDGYVPPQLVTPQVPVKPGTVHTQLTPKVAAAFEAMVAAARGDGHQLQLTSGYRSHADQQDVYDRFVRDYGPEVAAERVAVPGTSEHQTGLAVDVGQVGLPDDQEFGDQASSVWVRDHAHEFGFIIRYPPDKAEITGYTNEPWHLRYVGVELAAQLHGSGLTMEEHFGLVPAATG